MSEIIIGLVAIVAIAFIVESLKRSSSGARSAAEEEEDYISADEAGPTQSGRFRAQRVKAAIQKARQDPADGPSKPKAKEKPKEVKQKEASTHRSMAHEQVDNESSGTDLPDPFEIDLRDED